MHHIDYQQISLSELDRLAESIASVLPDRLAIGLVGTLGAGKTTWVQSLASQLHIETSDVTSPTFTLLNSHVGTGEHEGKVLHHIDAYRLVDEDEFMELGVDELFESDGWTVVEWADRVESCMPDGTLWISLRLSANDQARQVQLKSFNADLIESIKSASESFLT